MVTALARIEDDSQLDGLRQLPQARLFVFTLSLEELFVEFFDRPVAASGGQQGDRSGRSGSGVAEVSKKRVGKEAWVAADPCRGESDD